MAALLTVSVILGLFVAIGDGVPSNIYDALQPLGCVQFLAILNKCSYEVREQYQQNVRWTVFAPNDTAFNNLPPTRRAEILSMTQAESENYVKSFTLPKDLVTTRFRNNHKEQSRSALSTYIYFNTAARKEGDSASSIAGPTEYYANGARIVDGDNPAGQSIIHVIDRVLELPSDKSILGYISLEGQPDTTFHAKILTRITAPQYDTIVEPLNSQSRLTVLIPSKEAIDKIPREKLQILLGNPEKLNEVVKMHIIPDRVMYTSFVYHNEGINSMGKGQVIFRKNKAREAVFVNSGGVTAQITHGNITCNNGAVHFIDTLLGYVYNSALQEIELNSETQQFEDILMQARNELQQIIVSPSGVTLFVPVNEAFTDLPSIYNLYRNQSLINKIIELCLLEHGQEVPLTTVNGDYAARQTLTSQYYRHPVSVYSQGNETWIESGYVKARVVRPDVGVTNGFVHFIDAVPGVPNRDVPNTIFCEDWLIKSSLQLKVTRLNEYMRDTRVNTIAPCTTGGGVRSSPNVYSNNYNNPSTQEYSQASACGGHCRFTVFIPNGTAINFFENMPAGKHIQGNVDRWKYVLARHITRQVIFLDQTAMGQERTYTALNGNEVRYRRISDRYAYLYYQGKIAEVFHSDLGATNGVIHIISNVIYVEDDLYREDLTWTVSSADGQFPPLSFLCVLCVCVWHWLIQR